MKSIVQPSRNLGKTSALRSSVATTITGWIHDDDAKEIHLGEKEMKLFMEWLDDSGHRPPDLTDAHIQGTSPLKFCGATLHPTNTPSHLYTKQPKPPTDH